MNSGSGDGGSCFGIEVWPDTAKLTNNGLETDEIFVKKEVFIKHEADVSSRVHGVIF